MSASLLSTVFASGGSASFPILPALIFVPVVGAILIALMPSSRPELSRQMAILTALLTGILSIALLVQFKTDDAGFQFVVQQTWVQSLDIKFFLGVDGISLFLVVLTGILFPIALFAAKPAHSPKGYYAWLTLLMAGCMGAFLALDLFLFFLMFEITLVPLYMLIGKWGHGRRIYAATKFFLYTMLGSAFMLVSIVTLAVLAGAGDNGGVSFDFTKIIATDNLATSTGRWLFLGMAIAFAVKVPHMAARCTHRGSDCRFYRPCRHPPQARYLRFPSVRTRTVPRGNGVVRTSDAHLGHDRCGLWRHRRGDAEKSQATRCLLIGRTHGLRSHGPVRAQR